MPRFHPHFVRIDGPGEQPVGAGCLLVDRKIVTCAHVVADALGHRNLAYAEEKPEALLKVRFPFSLRWKELFDAEIIHWRPICHENERGLPDDGLSDMAMLLLAADTPVDVRPADLIDDFDLPGQDFEAYGFPKIGLADWRGRQTKGQIGGRQPPTWFSLEPTSVYGQKVREGFSGAPVWVRGHNAVGGIIAEFVSNPEMSEFGGVMIGVQALKQFDDAIAATLRLGQEALGAVLGAPGYPTRYVERTALLVRLRDRILGREGTVAVSGERGLGLHGMGGVGKTVLAAALVRDREVRRAFSDGIFWVTIGQNIDAASLQAQLYSHITGRSLAATTIEAGKEALREALEHRRVLIILDDLWQPQIAEAFPSAGDGWKLLITTRIREVIEEFGVVEEQVHVVEDREALALLEQYAGDAFPREPAQRDVLDGILKETGKLPLALALVGTMARRAGPGFWPDILQRLKDARLDRIAASIPDYKTYESLLKSLEASVATLSEAERARYTELGVFAEDTPLPMGVLEVLWGAQTADRLEVWELANTFVARALASWTADGRLALHDLQRDYIRATATDLPALHARLVDAYGLKCPDGWASGPNDGYFFQFLPHHLAAAGRLDELKALLADYAWMEAKLKATDVQSVISDYDLVANEPDLSLVQRALGLSIPALSRDWTHLPSQLIGRLREIDGPRIRALLEKASAGPGTAWLCPQTASLTASGPLLQTFAGHTGSVTALAVLPDGRALSGSDDRTLRLWDLASGESRVLEGHRDAVTALAVLPDGRVLSGSEDRTVRLWDLANGESRELTGHMGAVTALAVLPDGRALSGSDDRTLRLWDLASGESRVLEGHRDAVTVLAVLPDGRVLSGSEDRTVRLWDLASGESRVLERHLFAVTALAVLPDGRVLSGSEDGTLQLWDLASGSRVLECYTDAVTALAVLPDGRALSGSDDRTLRLWDLANGESRVLTGHMGAVTALAVLPDGRVLSGSEDRTLRLWDLASGESRVLTGHMGAVTALAVLPDGRVLSGSEDGTLRLWDLANGESRVLTGHMGAVTALAVLPDGRALSGSSDNTLWLWNLKSGKSRELKDRTGHVRGFIMGAVTALVVLPDGRALSGHRNGILWLWLSGEGCVLTGHRGGVTALAVLPDGRVLSGSDDRTLRLWDLANGESRELTGHRDGVTALAVLPDGRALSGSDDRTLRLWDLASGESRVLEGHTDGVTALAVLPDGRALSGSEDWSVIVWDVTRGDPLAAFIGDAAITCVAATPTHLLAGSASGAVHILRLRP